MVTWGSVWGRDRCEPAIGGGSRGDNGLRVVGLSDAYRSSATSLWVGPTSTSGALEFANTVGLNADFGRNSSRRCGRGLDPVRTHISGHGASSQLWRRGISHRAKRVSQRARGASPTGTLLDVSTDSPGWYPDLQPATERIGLEQRLEYCRSAVVAAAGRLDQVAAVAQPLPATALTIAGIVKHLAWVEDHYFVGKMLGQALPEPWASAPLSEDPDWPFHSARDDHIDDVVDLYRQACQRGRDIAAGPRVA